MLKNQTCEKMPSKNTKELSVIIVSYNNLSDLRTCLVSIQRFNDIGNELEVVVVEQSPEDDIYVFLTKEFPNVRTIRNENNGFGAGNNKGVSYSTGKYLLFLNPDTQLVEPIFSFAIKSFEKNKKLGLFGVRLIDKNNQKAQSFQFLEPIGALRGVLWSVFNFIDYFNSSFMYITGADIFIRRKLFFQCGGFDERLFMYCEEPDLCRRVKQQGYEIRFFKNKKIQHLEGGSSKECNTFNYELDSNAYYCSKYGIDYASTLRRWRRFLKIRNLFSHNKGLNQKKVSLIEKRIQSIDSISNN